MLSTVLGIRSVYVERREGQIKREEIRTGKIEIDLNKVKEIQEFVDEGHDPWRLDPEMVARAEALDFGFNREDLKNLEVVFEDLKGGTVHYKVVHKGKEYLLILVQPIVGKWKIWELSEIRELK